MDGDSDLPGTLVDFMICITLDEYDKLKFREFEDRTLELLRTV